MRKAVPIVSLIGLAVILLLTPSLHSTASTDTRHTIVGSWDVVTLGQRPQSSFLFTFFADGNIVATDVNGSTWHGAWSSESASTLYFDIHGLSKTEGGQGFSGEITIGQDRDNIPFMGGTLKRITAVPSTLDGLATPAP
jgi:hypothetical protein